LDLRDFKIVFPEAIYFGWEKNIFVEENFLNFFPVAFDS